MFKPKIPHDVRQDFFYPLSGASRCGVGCIQIWFFGEIPRENTIKKEGGSILQLNEDIQSNVNTTI